jgi:hypothetical protein
MTLTIELTPEEEAELRRRAKEEGLTQEDFLRRLVQERLSTRSRRQKMEPKERIEAERKRPGEEARRRAEEFLAWAKSHKTGAPPFPEGALARESIYDRETD